MKAGDNRLHVLSGIREYAWRKNGKSVAREGADFINAPRFPTAHRMDINPSKQGPFRWVVERSTATLIVVDLPNDIWP